MAINLKTVDDKELLYGTKICQGCGAGMAARMALKVLGEKTVLCTPACCFAATTTVFPQNMQKPLPRPRPVPTAS